MWPSLMSKSDCATVMATLDIAQLSDSFSVYEKALKHSTEWLNKPRLLLGILMGKGLTHFQVPWLPPNTIYLAEDCFQRQPGEKDQV